MGNEPTTETPSYHTKTTPPTLKNFSRNMIPIIPPNWKMSTITETPSIWKPSFSTSFPDSSYLWKIPSFIIKRCKVADHYDISEDARLKRQMEIKHFLDKHWGRGVPNEVRLIRMKEVYKMLNYLLTTEDAPSKDSPPPNFTYRSGNVNIIIYNFIWMLSSCLYVDKQRYRCSKNSSVHTEITNMYNQLNLALVGWNRRISDQKEHSKSSPTAPDIDPILEKKMK